MSTARWRHQTCDVPMDSVRVFHAGLSGMDVQLGSEVLWVESEAHFDDLVARAKQGFSSLPPRRCLPPRTDGMTANLAGSCWGENE